ncbi:CoA transferase [Amycolatopsis thermalba]|uniref:CoA transferase n=1 Tax=Amycolatopsis thermalba TaxID=944492 RepID=A0ABY4P6H6_9PSEU|nr:CaiB/BaiF CoA-transferase family protein [Amycolatopsis thermalba]UQS27924.1 CoA transferase [Amycolatopsis thermalba]
MGPLAGIKVLELAGIGPGPHAAMILADLGADVVRVERPSGGLQVLPPQARDHVLRGRRSIAADLKTPEGKRLVQQLIDKADVLLEGFRPGVAERLGVGPEDCLARNPRLVYGRMTGWGQDGPMAPRAGHDINYISLTGALHAVRDTAGKPIPPLNLVGDFGGGSMFLVTGVLAALVERAGSGRGQVVDAAMVDGASVLLQMVWALRAQGAWADEPGTNLLDTGCPYYDTYRCADGRYIAVGALEPQFYAELLKGLGLDGADLPAQGDRGGWPKLRERFTEVIASRTRDEWTAVFAGTDACVTPVLSFAEAAENEHLAARGSVRDINGGTQAAPAPRFSRTANAEPAPPATPGADTAEVIRDWGVQA